jgi:hypothetical protein
MFVFWTAIVIFLAIALPTTSRSHELTPTFFVFVALGIFGCAMIVISSWLFALALTEAQGVAQMGRDLEVTYVHFGRQRLSIPATGIRSIPVRLFRFNLERGFEPAWLLLFGGLRFAVVPRERLPIPLTNQQQGKQPGTD